MIYYEVAKPERHNGGDFYAHCLEFQVTNPTEGRAELIAYMESCDKLKTLDYRFRFIKRYEGVKEMFGRYGIPNLVHICILRFKNKNDAILFKLQHKN